MSTKENQGEECEYFSRIFGMSIHTMKKKNRNKLWYYEVPSKNDEIEDNFIKLFNARVQI